MTDYNLKVLELNRQDNMLSIGIRVKGPYDPVVHEPKAAVLFSNGEEIRRMPILLQAYFPAENLETCTIFAKYDYNMDYLFFQKPVNDRIDIWFEFTYGDRVIDHIPFTLSGDVKLDEDRQYKISFTRERTCFTFERKNKLPAEKEAIPVVAGIQNVIRSIWGIIIFLVGICCLPFFLMEGILEAFGCAKSAPGNDRTGIFRILNHTRWRFNRMVRQNIGKSDAKLKLAQKSFDFGCLFPVRKNRIVFISDRRRDLTGNFEFVYDILKEDQSLDMRFVLDDREIKDMSLGNAFRFGFYLATSKVILVDDYTQLLYKIPRRKGTTLIQLWHACGAFKTFGYSRMGKTGGQKQNNPAHRNYDYAIVSSREISKFYAEGFGLSLEKAVATGIPRTDIFFDTLYKEKVRKEFYQKYPGLKDKKIMLFAPTFRGNGKLSAFYPVEKFDPVRMYEALHGEYAILIKHHPFVQDRSIIPEKYKDVIIDLSENSELNDLLFVTDLLVTDYSSVIFEAALLDIPMLFYAYDLQRYISTRGFYYEFEKFVPGKIVYSFGQAIKAVENQDFEADKIQRFKTRFFDDLDGRSSYRVVELIRQSLQ